MDKESIPQTSINQPHPAVESQLPAPQPARKYNNLVPFLTLVVLILLSVSGYLGYNLYQLNNQKGKPVPDSYRPDVNPTQMPDPTSDWITYTNDVQLYTFKYPNSWSLDQTKANELVNSILTLTNEEAKINVYANMDGIGGQGRDYEGTEFIFGGVNLYLYNITSTYDNTRTLGLTDSLTNSLGLFQYNKKIYSISLKYPIDYDQSQVGADLQNIFKQILTTFKFANANDVIINSPTPSKIILDKTYTDKDFGYKISYPNTWVFQRTYGSDIPKAGTTDILSGIDLHYPAIVGQSLSVVVNILDAHGLTNINDWISKYDLNYPKNATKDSVSFHGINAVKYTYSNAPGQDNEAIFFINGSYAYRIYYYEKGGISENLRTVVESFNP